MAWHLCKLKLRPCEFTSGCRRPRPRPGYLKVPNVATVEVRFGAVVLIEKLVFNVAYEKIGVAGSHFGAQGQFASLDFFVNKCRHDIHKLNFNRNTKFSSLSSEERAALKSLSKRKDIIVKATDKGGALVVWRADLYQKQALRQLSDTSFYAVVDKDNQQIVKSTINDLIVKQELPATATNLVITTPRTSCIYFLPKIHKPNNPGRPIVSACSCPTELISSYLDKIMAPIVRSLPSYVKDSQHALQIFRDFNFLGEDKLIFTMDITSLYTVIPNCEGLLALKHFFDLRTVKNPSSETLLRMAELVLTLNCFSFAGSYYKQINGVAMGTKMGPSYANLFVGYIEHQFFNQYNGPKPDLYRRYIDDCVGATSSTREGLNQFITAVNSFHPALKYTWEISDTSLAFLDIKVSVEGNGLCTSVHYKPTDSHSYLLYLSSHPSHVKNSIPYSQFLRLRRLCSEDSDFSLNQRKCASFSTNVAILPLLLKEAIIAPNKLIGSQHYKRLRRRIATEFHSLSHFTLTTTQSNPSF